MQLSRNDETASQVENSSASYSLPEEGTWQAGMLTQRAPAHCQPGLSCWHLASH